MSAVPVVEVRGVHKTYLQRGTWPWSPTRDVLAVVDVNLRVERPRCLAVSWASRM